jgi:hypothetical protein
MFGGLLAAGSRSRDRHPDVGDAAGALTATAAGDRQRQLPVLPGGFGGRTGLDAPGGWRKSGQMNEDSTDGTDKASLSALYLETLRLRMEPDKFGALADALKGMKEASEAGFDGAASRSTRNCSPTTYAGSS